MVQVAVSLNICRPRACVTCFCDRRGEFRKRRNVGESRRTILAHQPHATISRKHQIGFEIVVEINWQNSFGERSDGRWTTRKWKRCTSGQAYFMAVGDSHNRGVPLSQVKTHGGYLPLRVLELETSPP